MEGTAALAAKRAVFTRLAGALQLTGVQVEYAWPGQGAERECVYGGGVRWTREPAGHDGYRELFLQHNIVGAYIRVRHPGHSVEENDMRAGQLGDQLEELLQVDPQLAGGLTYVGMTGGTADYNTDDDANLSILHYQVQIDCYVN